MHCSQIFPNTNLSASRAVLSSDEGSVASLSTERCCSHHGLLKDQERGQVQFMPSGCNAQRQSTYCTNGVPWDALSDEDATVCSGVLGDTLSSIESTGEDEYVTKGNCRTAPEPLEPSILPSPSRGGLHRHAMGTGSCQLACAVGRKSGRAWGPPLSTRTGIPLESLKLQNVLDLQGLIHEPGSDIPGEDYSETQVQHTTESLPRQEPCGKDTGGPPGSHPEGSDAKTRRSPGYELRPAILFGKLTL